MQTRFDYFHHVTGDAVTIIIYHFTNTSTSQGKIWHPIRKLNQASPVENSPGCQKYVAKQSELNGGTPFVGIVAPFL
jgi:hypothetical protein